MQGNPGKRRLPKREPQPKVAAPSCPAWLSAEAKREWRRVTKELITLGLLTRLDRSALAAYCQCYARWREAERAIAEHGFTFETEKGYVGVRPEVGIANRALQAMHKFLTEFGLSPASRTRVTAIRPERKEDPIEEFFGAAKDKA